MSIDFALLEQLSKSVPIKENLTKDDFVKNILIGQIAGLNNEEQVIWAEAVLSDFILDILRRVENLEKNAITITP